MNNYIIDPSVFYWINVLSFTQTALAIIGIFMLIGGIVLGIAYSMESYDLHEPAKLPEDASAYDRSEYNSDLRRYNEKRDLTRTLKRWMIPSLICGSVFIVASIFIPGKSTSVEMLVARTATFDNVNWTVQQVKEIVDYIVSALKGV